MSAFAGVSAECGALGLALEMEAGEGRRARPSRCSRCGGGAEEIGAEAEGFEADAPTAAPAEAEAEAAAAFLNFFASFAFRLAARSREGESVLVSAGVGETTAASVLVSASALVEEGGLRVRLRERRKIESSLGVRCCVVYGKCCVCKRYYITRRCRYSFDSHIGGVFLVRSNMTFSCVRMCALTPMTARRVSSNISAGGESAGEVEVESDPDARSAAGTEMPPS